jgi:RNA-directed DNA polymerase
MKLLELLNIETGASIETIRRIISTAPRRYKVYEIPKRRGGTRTIAHPAQELKAIQRILLSHVLDKIEVSPIAMAYVKGRGIVANAREHLGQRWILKLDFKGFFPSITPKDWDRVARRTPALREFASDQELLHRILFWGGGGKEPQCLSIGAPTSPAVSNLVCVRMDEWMMARAHKRGLHITRYADDVTISGSNIHQIIRFEKQFREAMERSKGLKFEFNDDKRGIYGPGERRMVTGLILTPDNKISIGRERKREISALVHKVVVGKGSDELLMRCKGLLAFAISAEHGFFESMERKYGKQTISEILRANAPGQDDVIDLNF